jgi:Domain of unknown function (DUF1816)
MSNPVGRLLESLFGIRKDWWIEVKTEAPSCTYFFGPFSEEIEAQAAQAGYIEDLEGEGAQQIRAEIKRCPWPERLTVSDDSDDYRGASSPALSV